VLTDPLSLFPDLPPAPPPPRRHRCPLCRAGFAPVGASQRIADQRAKAGRDYAAEWAAFVAARPDIATWLTAAVEACRVAGHRRIAVNAIVEEARRLFVTPIDNSWRAALADRLIAADPRLDGLIERRRRRVTR